MRHIYRMLLAAAVVVCTCVVLSGGKALADEPGAASPSVTYRAHVQDVGWQDSVSDGATAGTSGQSLRVEALELRASGIDAVVEYRAHVQDVGWQDWVRDGATAGTSGQSLRVEALELRLVGADSQRYDIEYRTHVQDVGWQGWVRNGMTAGTTGQSLRVEAIEVRLVRRPDVRIAYRAHVQDVGWQDEVVGDAVAGTSGQSLRMEALELRADNALGLSGGVAYTAHVQDIGWQDEVADGVACGTEGRSLRVEAIRVRLTGELGERYSVWYRTHVQNVGWTSWACDGEDSGSYGLSLRLEGFQACIVEKGQPGPSADDAATALTCVAPASLTYAACVQGSGWQDEASDLATAGAPGESRGVEAIRVSANVQDGGGSVEYRAKPMGEDWQDWRADGAEAGSPSSGVPIEAFEARLTGTIAGTYDIWYRAHVQDMGWMGWTSNAGTSGTETLGRMIEAVELCLVPVGSPAPGPTARPYTDVLKRPRMILVGDSRTYAMYDAWYGSDSDSWDLFTTDPDGNIWSARIGAGYPWMVSTGVPYIEASIGSDTAVVILMGINDALNDLSAWQSYANYLNQKAPEWVARGASVYYVSLTPIGANAADDYYDGDTNAGTVCVWNDAIRGALCDDVIYLDAYHAVLDTYTTADGVHFQNPTNRRIYQYLLDEVF